MRLLLTLTLLALAACEPFEPEIPTTRHLRLTNRYLESIFTVRGGPAGGALETLAEGRRLDTGETLDLPDALDAEDGAELRIEIDATSLGRTESYAVETTVEGGAYAVEYDYDLARAEFRLRGGWRRR